MIQPSTGRHQERKYWKETEKERLWEERRDWRLFI
jgi:hypothetical protein